MNSTKARTALALLATLARPLAGQSLTVTNQDGAVKTFTAADLRALPQLEARAGSTGQDTVRRVFRGPGLREILTRAGVPTGHDLRGPAMLLVVVATAADSYKVAYTVAELDADFAAKPAIVALTMDGNPLPQGDGPMRVILANEERRARWIRQLVAIRVMKARSS